MSDQQFEKLMTSLCTNWGIIWVSFTTGQRWWSLDTRVSSRHTFTRLCLGPLSLDTFMSRLGSVSWLSWCVL